jgi:hypothetical protein
VLFVSFILFIYLFFCLRMAGDGNVPPAVQEVEVTSKVLEEAEKPKTHKDVETEPQERAELEKKDIPQEETNAAQDNARNKYVILMCEDILNPHLLFTV